MSRRRRRQPRVPGMSTGPTVSVLPGIDDQLDPKVKNALAVRNAATVAGRCPVCGARGERHPVEHGIWRLLFRHDDGCPALRDPHDWRDLGEDVA